MGSTGVNNCPNKVIRFSWSYSNKARTAQPDSPS